MTTRSAAEAPRDTPGQQGCIRTSEGYPGWVYRPCVQAWMGLWIFVFLVDVSLSIMDFYDKN